MASTLKINTLTGVTTAGSIAVTGEGNSTTTNLQQGLAKAWVNFDGQSTATVQNSLNHSSIEDQGTGQYRFTVTNAFANVNSVFTCTTGNRSTTNAGIDRNSQMGTDDTTRFHYELHDISGGGNADAVVGHAVVHGDLA